MSSFRFLHAADIHLDSPLRGLDLGDSAIAEQVRAAPRAAFRSLVRYAIEERVDFVVIAGDLYDGDWPDMGTGLFFVEQMGRLNEAGIPALVLHGNHDAQSVITRRLTLPPNVRVFSSRRAETFALEDLGVFLHGRSFPNRAVPENLVPAYPDPRENAFNIGVLHTSLAGHEYHDTYAPCSIEDLMAKGYDYWALGHIHERRIGDGPPWIAYPGNLQGRHPRETGPKGAYVVSVADGAAGKPEPVNFDQVRWEVVSVSAQDLPTIEDILDAVRDRIAEAQERSGRRALVCRVQVAGRTPAHPELVADPERLLNETRAVAAGLGGEPVAVERVVVSTSAPEDPDTMRAREDAVGELLGLIGSADVRAGDLRDALDSTMGVFANRLPASLAAAEDPALRALVERDWAGLVRAVRPYLEARARQQS